MATRRFKLVASDQSALQVYEVMTLGEKVSDKSAFCQCEAFFDLLPRFGDVLAD